MTLKWTMDSVWSAALVIVTIIGGCYAVVYHQGASASQIEVIQQKQTDEDAHLAKHDDQLSTIQQQNSASAQALGDIKDQLNRMEKKL